MPDDQSPDNTSPSNSPNDVAADAAMGRNADEDGSIDPALSSDVEANREELHEAMSTLQATNASQDRKASFGRQMIQLALIPAIIVAGVIGVWIMITALTGRSQSLEAVLSSLERLPVITSNVDIAAVPGRQQGFRDAMTLAAMLDGDELTLEQVQTTKTRLIALAQRHQGADSQIFAFLMLSLGTLADPDTLNLFREALQSENANDQLAAVRGLWKWQQNGDIGDARGLTPDVAMLLVDGTDLKAQTLAAALLGGLATPEDMAVRDALASLIDRATQENREAVWNAGCALAVLGDDRGFPVVMSLLDRSWLATQLDTTDPTRGTFTTESQNKILKTVLNVIVKYVPSSSEEGEGRFEVCVDHPTIWTMVEQLAADDASEEVRVVAQKVLDVRDQ